MGKAYLIDLVVVSASGFLESALDEETLDLDLLPHHLLLILKHLDLCPGAS